MSFIILFEWLGNANLNNRGEKFLISFLTYNLAFEYTEPNFFISMTLESIFATHNEIALGVPIGFYATKKLKFWLTFRLCTW